MNRKDKIRLLTDLSKGRISPADTAPKALDRVISSDPAKRKYCINGEEVSEETYQAEEERQERLFGPSMLEVYIGGVKISED